MKSPQFFLTLYRQKETVRICQIFEAFLKNINITYKFKEFF